MAPTTIIFNNDNFLLWSQIFHVFVGARRRIGHLLEGLLDMKDSSYSNWFANNCHVISKPLNCIKEKVSSGIMFLKTAKEYWILLKRYMTMRRILLES